MSEGGAEGERESEQEQASQADSTLGVETNTKLHPQPWDCDLNLSQELDAYLNEPPRGP